MIELIVFDLDDTLIPEIEYVKSGFHVVAEYLEKTYGCHNAYEDLLKLFHQDSKMVFNRFLAAKGISEKGEEISHLVDIYRHHEPQISFYPDVFPTLADLKRHGMKSAILTDGLLQTQKQKVKAVEAESLFDAILYTDALGKEFWKPSPKGFEILKEKFHVDYESMIYVGDNPQKDFYIASIHPIHTVRVLREDAIYKDEPYLGGIQEEYTLKDFRSLWEVIDRFGASMNPKFYTE